MDFSDRIRRAQLKTVAIDNTPSFLATWSSAATTITYVSGTVPKVGVYVNYTGIPSDTMVLSVSGTTVTITKATTTTQSTAVRVIITPSGPSVTTFDSYEKKYNTQGGLSYVNFDTGVATYASTIGSFGCEGR